MTRPMTDMQAELDALRATATDPRHQRDWGTGMARLLDAVERILAIPNITSDPWLRAYAAAVADVRYHIEEALLGDTDG